MCPIQAVRKKEMDGYFYDFMGERLTPMTLSLSEQKSLKSSSHSEIQVNS